MKIWKKNERKKKDWKEQTKEQKIEEKKEVKEERTIKKGGNKNKEQGKKERRIEGKKESNERCLQDVDEWVSLLVMKFRDLTEQWKNKKKTNIHLSGNLFRELKPSDNFLQ